MLDALNAKKNFGKVKMKYPGFVRNAKNNLMIVFIHTIS